MDFSGLAQIANGIPGGYEAGDNMMQRFDDMRARRLRGQAALQAAQQGMTPPNAVPPGQPSMPGGPPGGGLGALGSGPPMPNFMQQPPGGSPMDERVRPPSPYRPMDEHAPPMDPGMSAPAGGPLAQNIQQGIQSGAPVGNGTPPPGAMTAAPQGGQGGQGSGLSGVAEPTGNVYGDIQKTLQNIAQPLVRANPHVRPEVLLAAMSQQIEMMKGLSPEARIYAQMSIADRRATVSMQEALAKVTSAQALMQKRIEMEEERLATMKQIASGHDKARTDSASIAGKSRTDSAGISAGARVESAGIAADARTDAAETAAGASDYRADQGYRGRMNPADIKAGLLAQAAPGPRRAHAPTRPRGAGGAAPAASGAPPMNAGAYKDHVAVSPDGKRWKSDGKRWVAQ